MKNSNTMHRIAFFSIGVLLTIIVISCGQNYIPKPHGYIRFDLPQKQYKLIDTLLPYKFEYPVYGKIVPIDNKTEPYWINLVFPNYNATIHISYKHIKGNLPEILEDTYQLVYKHTVKADAITEQAFENPPKKVYGFLYELGGNTATSVQFYLTDSVSNFIRGALYFYAEPNIDSLAPLINFFKGDIQHMMETVEWVDIK